MLNYKTVSVVYIVLAGLNSIFFIFFPYLSLNALQASTDAFGLFAMQMAGACALGLTVITSFSLASRDTQQKRGVLIGNLTTVVVLTAIDLIAIRNHAFNWAGWIFVAGDSLMSVAFIWLLVKKLN